MGLARFRATTVAWAAVGALVATLTAPGAQIAVMGADQAVEGAMLLREVYGLPAGRSEVQSLIGSSRDVGSDRYGIPMTQAEVDNVDPDGRAKFSRAVRRDVLPWLEDEPKYAGAWLDQKKNGRLVVALTDISNGEEGSLCSCVAQEVPPVTGSLRYLLELCGAFVVACPESSSARSRSKTLSLSMPAR